MWWEGPATKDLEVIAYLLHNKEIPTYVKSK